MYIDFYKVSMNARYDYRDLCQTSTKKTLAQAEQDDTGEVVELNRKIRRMANLGKLIDDTNGFKTVLYFDLLIAIKDYEVISIYRTSDYPPYIVAEAIKKKYNWLEKKLTDKRK